MIEKQTAPPRPIEVDRVAWRYYSSLYKGSYRWLSFCMIASFFQAIARQAQLMYVLREGRTVSSDRTEMNAQESQIL